MEKAGTETAAVQEGAMAMAGEEPKEPMEEAATETASVGEGPVEATSDEPSKMTQASTQEKKVWVRRTRSETVVMELLTTDHECTCVCPLGDGGGFL